MEVNPDVVNVTSATPSAVVLVTVPDPATVNPPEVSSPVTTSLNVTTIVLSAVLSAVNVGADACAS